MGFPRNKDIMAEYKEEAINRVTTDNSGTYTTTLTVRDLVNLFDTTLGVGTAYLPDVTKAAGLLLTFRIVAGANAMTIADNDESVDWSDLATLDAVLDRVAYYSDGFAWYQMASDIA